jgi:hypothetical protein
MPGYYELYQQAMKDIDAQGIPNNTRAYDLAVLKRHKELVEEHKPTDMPFTWHGDNFDSDLRYEDRETRIASGEERWQGGEV